MEDKQAICDALLTTLKLTRRYENLVYIDYDEATETVTVIYSAIARTFVGVEGDSGIAMIRDILNHII